MESRRPPCPSLHFCRCLFGTVETGAGIGKHRRKILVKPKRRKTLGTESKEVQRSCTSYAQHLLQRHASVPEVVIRENGDAGGNGVVGQRNGLSAAGKPLNGRMLISLLCHHERRFNREASK